MALASYVRFYTICDSILSLSEETGALPGNAPVQPSNLQENRAFTALIPIAGAGCRLLGGLHGHARGAYGYRGGHGACRA